MNPLFTPHADRPRRNQTGFTLMEIMVAVGIFAVLGVLAYGGVASIVRTSERTDQEAQRLRELQSAMNFLQRDIEQAVPRGIRDQYGDRQPALHGGGISLIRLELTRTGRPNPLQLPRSNLQRVGYRLTENTLVRLTWQTLDRPPEAQPEELALLEGVRQLDLRFLDGDNQWHDQWPPLAQQIPGSTGSEKMPKAVEINLELEDWHNIRRVLQLAAEGIS